MPGPQFESTSRVMMFAPHPDDESLACGILLQRAVQAGAGVRIVYITDGENNPWPQRFLWRRWRINSIDRQRWAKLRRIEALAALNLLGVAPADARFLAWPDQELERLLISDCAASLARLRHLILDWSPTDILVPHVADRHRDHRALGGMFRLLFSGSVSRVQQIRKWSYMVHGVDRGFLRRAYIVPQTHSQVETKRRAISCHQTQLMLSRRRFLGYATRPERLLEIIQHKIATDIHSLEEVVEPGLHRSSARQFAFPLSGSK